MAEAARRGIDETAVEAVAELARLALRPGEARAMARDLDRILRAAEVLAALDLEGLDSAYRPAAEAAAEGQRPSGPGGERPAVGVMPGDAGARLRPDAPGACLGREAALAGAPRHDEAFFLVPTVVERS